MRNPINVLALLTLGLVGVAHAQALDLTDPANWWFGNPDAPNSGPEYMTYVAPDEATIPNDAAGAMIRYGKQLLEETYKLLGPESGMPNTHVTSRLSCTNCHIESGRAAYGQPWAAVWYKYNVNRGRGPWSARSNRFLDMKNRIHDCTIRSMNGTQLPDDSRELLAMIAYMEWLATGIKVPDVPPAGAPIAGVPIWDKLGKLGAGNVPVRELTRAADPVAGKLVYEDKCAACHGYTGEGVWDPAARKYIYPAVWGPFSFNDGAGMYRLRTAVGFIKGNMPYGWANPTDPSHMLSDAEAWDAMAYLISNERPKFAGAQQDWLHYRPTDCAPNWVLKVTQLDAGYEWYFPRIKPDGTLTGDVSYPPKYSAARHKYGPWKDMLTEMQKIQNAYLAQTPHPAFPDCRPFEYKEPLAAGQRLDRAPAGPVPRPGDASGQDAADRPRAPTRAVPRVRCRD
jgi:thiosulfate dehydrogenase